MSLILYDYPLAYNPAKARLMLIEKGLPYTTRFVNLFNGESLSPEFLKENCAGTVPVLVDGQTTVAESLQIVRYVDGLGAGPLGGDDVDRSFVEEWGQRVDAWDGNLFLAANSADGAKKAMQRLGDFRMKFAEARAAEHPELREVYERKMAAMRATSALNEDAAAAQANDQRLLALLDDAEGRLSRAPAAAAAGGPWLAGPAYSQADVLLTTVLFRIHMAKLQSRYIDPRPHLQSYCQRVQQRPSWGKAFGPALSGGTTLRLVGPALAKAWWKGVTKRY